MTDQELIENIRLHLDHESLNLTEVHSILMRYKMAGGKQEDAYRLIHTWAMENSAMEAMQDKLFEVLDVVSSFCNQELIVWDSVLT